ncbi:MAG: hypothetical protein PHC65_07010 [Methanobacteriaceae archaeon]|nr:hypothetical protein [Methanobacteriaceae archaeon]
MFIIIFSLIYILSYDSLRVKCSKFLYKFRYPLILVLFLICVIFEIHGSSIAQLSLFNVDSHNSLLGISRVIRSDEFNVNTVMAFSQYHNGFSYFSSILRATPTDMFLLYGQPVWNLVGLFRPFHWGYLFLTPGKGLSFFWVGRLLGLLLVSFEMGMFLTKENKTLSLAYALLLTFSPLVQWWFSVNGLVEMLIFGQLAILLINYYMNTISYKKRLLCTLGLIISIGAFLLAVYPAWEIPLAYIFLTLSIAIFLLNKKSFKYSKKDLILSLLFVTILGLSMFYIFLKSHQTIISLLNTSYPGLRNYVGGGNFLYAFDYMGSLFYSIIPQRFNVQVNNFSFIISFFPLSIILYIIVTFVQKQKDIILNSLMVIYVFLGSYYLFSWPAIIGKVTLLGKSTDFRLLVILSFLDLLILIRSMGLLKHINFNIFKSKIFSKFNALFKNRFSFVLGFLMAGIILFISIWASNFHYNMFMIMILMIIFGFSFFFILNSGENKKAQTGFLVCILIISFTGGALVNPIESGVDVYFNQAPIQEVSHIVQNDPNATWIVEGNGIYIDELIPVGAHTLNSVNTYPNLKAWSSLDSNNNNLSIYNRYAHVPTFLTKDNTSFNLIQADVFALSLNINDLEKLNVSYIFTKNDLSGLNSDKVNFNKIYDHDGYKIYNIIYSKN